MSCLITLLLLFSPRLAILVWWLMDSPHINLAFQTWTKPFQSQFMWIWPLLGAIFAPWTTVAYLFVFPGGIAGLEWLWLGLGLLLDLGAHFGGGYRQLRRSPRFNR